MKNINQYICLITSCKKSDTSIFHFSLFIFLFTNALTYGWSVNPSAKYALPLLGLAVI